MMIESPVGFPTAIPAVSRSEARKPAEDSRVGQNVDSSAQFAAFLTMVVGNDPKLRSDLQKQLPEESAGLLDRLLSSSSDALPDMPSAVDAARYGMLTDGTHGAGITSGTPAGSLRVSTAPASSVTASTAPASTAPASTAPASTAPAPAAPASAAPASTAPAPAAPASTAPASTAPASTAPTGTSVDHKLTRAEINKINRSKAAEVLGSLSNGGGSAFDGLNHTGAQRRISQSTLARVTARQSPSLEELIARRDYEGARVRAGIDNVLTKSGTDEGLALASNHAANVALSAALIASANDVSTPINDVAALDPELRVRLARVIDRMKTEYGHDVTVVETARSQERQDVLYAQGRTTPGNIVTKTLDSKHTQGEAVDVIIDGTWANAKGFARLQEFAKEEGLKTLGMSDPGHLELPKDSWTLNGDVRVTSASSDAASSNGIARVATVARVASVGAGMNIGPTAPEIPAVPQPTVSTNGATGLLPQQRASSGNANSGSSSESSSDSSSRKPLLKGTANVEARAAGQSYQETPADFKTKFVGPLDETQRPSGASAADAVDRVQDINAMREQQGAKPLSHLTLEIDNTDGTTQQIRMDIRGKSVDAHITTDGISADRLRANVSELRMGLENRGLEADNLRFSSQGSRDKSSSARDWDDKQASREEQRAQNRDAQGRGSGNQDRQRPQYQEKQ